MCTVDMCRAKEAYIETMSPEQEAGVRDSSERLELHVCVKC